MRINSVIFPTESESARHFYEENGFVCFSSVAPDELLGGIQQAWTALVDQCAAEVGVDRKQYLDDISQWRDLGKTDDFLLELLSDRLSLFAAWGLGLPGSRLLYDHFIRKSSHAANGEIPWHQDSMYLPVDRTGCATWLAVDDASEHSGCLEVIAGSHRGKIGRPVDFMGERVEQDHETITAIPVRAGDLVIMNSKLWHRSQQATVAGNRLAHLGFWVPEETRYSPEHAQWHVLNKQISVSAGSLLNEDEFPVFGQRSTQHGSSDENDHEGVEQPHGMFNARARIERMVGQMTGVNGSLGQMLSDSSVRERLAEKVCSVDFNFDDSLRLVERVWVSAAAFEMHGSRNVFDSAYSAWESRFEMDE